MGGGVVDSIHPCFLPAASRDFRFKEFCVPATNKKFRTKNQGLLIVETKDQGLPNVETKDQPRFAKLKPKANQGLPKD